MKYLALAALGLFTATTALAVEVDLNNLPEPSVELCTNPEFMTELSKQMQGLTDTAKLQNVQQFIVKCQTVMTQQQ
ncbi:MAG: hypothetical protein IAA31_00680 [Candidatus Anaerobiospirillum merdipullorum]|uniref:Uncharacterized protein n=1 Tax=Candidatus Anaerobiospirillum merdipullorum TaxID=2838450 RepID=A0A9E2NRA1_9GAMM|nr:hypothetical protein [Candidatus Anaerobiospirillum merdipullorum]